MASFSAGTTFTDGVANDVTAAKLAALVNAATPTSGLIQDRTAETTIASNDTLLFGDASASDDLKRITVSNLFKTDVSITSATGTAGTVAIGPTGDTNTGIFFPAADTIAFSEGGAEAMRIDSSGNVGIGTTSPAAKIHVQGAGTTSGSYTNGDAVGQTLYLQDTGNLAGNGGQILFGASQGIFAGIKSSIVSGTGPAGNLIFQTRDTSGNVLDRMVVNREGNVGIGTASPACRLHLVAPDVQLRFTNGSSHVRHLGVVDADNSLRIVRTGVADDVTINSSGNVGIGTSSPTAQLELSTDSAKKPSTNTWTIASDQRLKTNITNADNDRCYEIVKQVPLKRYTWKNEVYSQDKVKDRSKLGWIAQDVEAVFPKAVGTNRFAYNQVFEDVVTPELDSDGNAVLDENGVAKTKTEKRLVRVTD